MNDQSPARIDLQQEMMLRGFQAILEGKGPRPEYAEAYDAWLVENGLDGFIGDSPENVRETFYEIMERDPVDPR